MKRNLLLLVVILASAVLSMSNQTFARVQCCQFADSCKMLEPDTCRAVGGTPSGQGTVCENNLCKDDLGEPDTIYVETFPCDNIYEATAGYDSVRVAIWVTHDSNSFYWDEGQRWVQDSISTFVIPLKFWKMGCADSVIFPKWGNWNNTKTSRTHELFKRSMFRDLECEGTIYYNRFADMSEAGYDDWTYGTAVVSHDPGHSFLTAIAFSPDCVRWWEGSRVLLATFTFLVYMKPDCDSTTICLDSTFWVPSNSLSFTRYDANSYVPIHFFPTCDTIYTSVKWIEDPTEKESKPTTFLVSQNYPNPFNPVTNFKLSLPKTSHVKVEIFNILAQKVKTLLDDDMKAGTYLVDWDGKDEKGANVSSGIYFYRIVAGDFSDINKMVLLR